MDIKKAVIPVAGRGTRFLPITKQVPKEMLPILDRPIIHYIVQEVLEAGIEEVIFVTSCGKELIENYFDRNLELEHFLRENGKREDAQLVRDIGQMIGVNTVRQKCQLGLGHAILCAEHIVGREDFVVLLGDEILLSSKTSAIGQLIHIYKKYGMSSVVGAMRISKDETDRYGIIDGRDEGDGKTFILKKMVEKPHPSKAPSTLAAPGRYVFTSDIFNFLKKIKKGVGGEYQLTDAINLIAQESSVYAHLIEGERYDVGNLLGHLNATINFALKREETREFTTSLLKEKVKHL